jgi:type IV pilus assembly protein PilM
MGLRFDIFKPKTPPMIGLDIGSTSIKIVELAKESSGGLRLEKYAIEPLPAGAVVDGNVVQAEEVAAAIKRALRRCGASARHVAISMPTSHLAMKTIAMSSLLTEGDIESQIATEAEPHIPFSVAEASLDFVMLGPDREDPEEQHVLLAAVRKDKLDERVASIDLAGLKCTAVDSEFFATLAAIDLLAPASQYRDKNIVYAVVEDEFVTVRVFRNGEEVFSREQNFGGQRLVSDIANRYGVDITEAEKILKDASKQPEGYIDDVVIPFSEMVAQEIARAVQMFTSSTSHDTADLLLVGGEIASSLDFYSVVARHVTVPVKVANPFAGMKLAQSLGRKFVDIDAPQLMVAAGMALRKFDAGQSNAKRDENSASLLRLNMLPYREVQRAALRRQFLYTAGFVASMGVAVALLVHGVISGYIAVQESRNAYISSENARLDNQITEIKRINTDIDALLARKQVIESLQSDRAQAIQILDQMVRLVPPGVYLTSLKQSGLTVVITGYAPSSDQVSEFMVNIQNSAFLEKPELVEIKGEVVGKRRLSSFVLNYAVKRPKASNDEAGQKAPKKTKVVSG